MSTAPSDPDYINPKALAGFMRAFDKALTGKYELSGGAMVHSEETLIEISRTPAPLVGVRIKRPPLKFWHTFPLVRTIVRLRDNIRLRKYNREWIKNNIH